MPVSALAKVKATVYIICFLKQPPYFLKPMAADTHARKAAFCPCGHPIQRRICNYICLSNLKLFSDN